VSLHPELVITGDDFRSDILRYGDSSQAQLPNATLPSYCAPSECAKEYILKGISTRTRDIFFALCAGNSYEQIAADMGISIPIIKGHFSRALLALMEADEADS